MWLLRLFLSFVIVLPKPVLALNDVSTQSGQNVGIYEIFGAADDPRYNSYSIVGGVTFGKYQPWNTYMDPGLYCPRVQPSDQYNWGGDYKTRDGSVSSLGPDGARTLISGYSGTFLLKNNNPFAVYARVYLNSNYCYSGYGQACHDNENVSLKTVFLTAGGTTSISVDGMSTIDAAAQRCGSYQLDATLVSVSQVEASLNTHPTILSEGASDGWCEAGETCEYYGSIGVCQQTGVAGTYRPVPTDLAANGHGCNLRRRIVDSLGQDASYYYLSSESAFHPDVNLNWSNSDVFPAGSKQYCAPDCTYPSPGRFSLFYDANNCKVACRFDVSPQVASLCQTGIDSGGAPNYCASDVSYKCDQSWGSCGCTGRGCRNDYNDPTVLSDTNNGGPYDSSLPNSAAQSGNYFHTDLRCCHSACVNNSCAMAFGVGVNNNECNANGTNDGQACGCTAPADPDTNSLSTNIDCTNQTVTFSWNQVNGATSYDLLVYDNGTHGEILNVAGITTNSYVWNGARAVYGYDWQIRANRACTNLTTHSGWVGKTLWTPGVPKCTITSPYTIFPGNSGQLNINGTVDEQSKSVDLYAWTTSSDGSGSGVNPGAINPNDPLDSTDGRADRRLYTSNGPLAVGGNWSSNINLGNHPNTDSTNFKMYAQANSCLPTNQAVPTCGPIYVQRVNKTCSINLGIGPSFSQTDSLNVTYSGNASLSPGTEDVKLKYVKVGQANSTQVDTCTSANATICNKSYAFSGNFFQPGDYYVYCALDAGLGACSGDPNSALVSCGTDDRKMITVLPENPPTVSSTELRNEASQTITPDSLGRNHTCENQITNDKVVISIKATDLQGVNDIVAISSRLVDVTNNNVLGVLSSSFSNGVMTSDQIGVGTKYENTTSQVIGGQLQVDWHVQLPPNLNKMYKIQVLATDSKGLTTNWIDSGRSIKIWDCKVSVTGTVYSAGSVVPNCQTGDGFNNQYARSDFSAINFVVSGGGTINGVINGSSQYSLNDTFTYGAGKTYKPNLTINSVVTANARIKQVGNNSIDCASTVDLSSSSLSFDPYSNNQSLTVDFSGTEIYPGWWQVENSNVKSGGKVIDSISPRCGEVVGSTCVKSIGITTNTNLSLQGVILGNSIEGTSGCVDCKKGGPEWYVDNRDYLVPILTYDSLWQKVKEANVTVNMVGDYGMSLLGTNPSGIYFVDGTFTVDKNNTVAPGNYFLVVAKKIIVMPAVTNMEGMFIAANSSNSRANFEATGDVALQLLIRGGVYASGDIVFKRTLTGNYKLDNNEKPAVKVVYDPSFLFNLPKELFVGLVNWRER